MDSPDLKASQHYINRELSFLEFNQRVLAQAFDEAVPLLERLKFLCISSSNLDEFFEIRYVGRPTAGAGLPGNSPPDALSLSDQLARTISALMRLCTDQYRCLNDVLMPALSSQGISLQGRAAWSPAAEKWLERYFEHEIEPVLSPLGLDPARPFPGIQNKSLNFVVKLRGKDAFGRDSEHAIVQAPRSLPRVVSGTERGAPERTLMLLSVIVHTFVQKLFAGIAVTRLLSVSRPRNSDLFVDDEEIDDLRRALEGELAHRRYGAAVRLETSSDCPEDMVQFLLHQFALTDVDMYTNAGAGQSQPPVGHLRSGTPPRPQISHLHPGTAQAARQQQ